MKKDLTDGEVFYAYVEHIENDGQGKTRPVLALKDPETDGWLVLKITSRIDKKLNHKYGYMLSDWEKCGLDKPSIVKCNREDIRDIQPDNITKKIGELTTRDLKGLLVKFIKVREIEFRRDLRNTNDLER